MRDFKRAALGRLALLAGMACVAASHAEDLPVTSIQSVTGPLAFAGSPYQKAIRLAVDEVNAKGGINGNRIALRDAYLRLKDVPVVIDSGLWNQTDRRPNYGALVLVARDARFVAPP